MLRLIQTRLRATALIAVGAVALVIVGGALGRTPATPAPTSDEAMVSTVDHLDQDINQSQERLRRVPGDWQAWAALGMAYLERARISSDPTYYPKADEAVRRSLQVRPNDNTDALVAEGALANARHDFAAAQRYAQAAIGLNAYHSEAYAVLADAETQLGRPEAATQALQHLLDLRPGLSGYARASYDLEQRGRNAEAADVMRRALDVSVDRHDIAFCRGQLGDLALNAGDTATATTEYAAGLAADPTSVPLQRGRARLLAMSGRTDEALAAYQALTRRAPTPGYLLEYAELLLAAGQTAPAQTQLRLAAAAHQLFTGNGGADGITGAAIAQAMGRPDDAVRQARAEWDRRQHADVADTLGWSLHLSGQDSAALEYARRAFDTGARSATYAYHFGMIEKALGYRGPAAQHLGRAVSINPRFSPLDGPRAIAALRDLTSRES